MFLIRIVVLLVLITFFNACNNQSFQVNEKGLEYLFVVENGKNSKPEVGDVLTLQLRFTTENGDLLEESAMFRKQLDQPSHQGGSIEDALAIMHVGDSAIFKIDANNYYKKTRRIDLPDNVKLGEKLVFYIKLLNVTPYSEFAQERERARISDEREEDTQLKAYLTRANIAVEPSPTGLYIVEIKAGNGVHPTPGKKVAVHYIGYFIDGRMFDSSYNRKEPFEFDYGMGQVIQGWEEALGKMQVGGKYKLIIPSYLAYGDVQFGPIPPNSTLIFDIELLQAEN